MPQDFDPSTLPQDSILTPTLKVSAVVGTGAMGRGIAQLLAQAGLQVYLYDQSAEGANKAREYISSMLASMAKKGRISPADAETITARLHVVSSLSEMADCDIVVEAVLESLSVKQELFSQLENIVPEECILATNTSSLSVTAIASVCRIPWRVAGYHFFNPPPLMKIVEVVPGLHTSRATCLALHQLCKRFGHVSVETQDTPGFIVNHAGRGYGTEALQILQEGVASFDQIDRVMEESAGFRLGPFALLDLTGVDVSHPVMESIYHQYYQEPRFRPSVLLQQRKEGKLLGRKTGQGFYRYSATLEKEHIPVEPPPKPAFPLQDITVWLGPENTHVPYLAGSGMKKHLADRSSLADWLRARQIRVSHEKQPGADDLIILTPLGFDASTSALAEGLDARRVLAIDLLLPWEKRRTLMYTPITRAEYRNTAHALFAGDGVPVTVIRDSPGFIAQRILATVVNIACDIVQKRICSPKDLDQAVMLGLSYPQGPLAWGDALGANRILTILRQLQEQTGDPRYRPSLWLQRRAGLEVSLLTAD